MKECNALKCTTNGTHMDKSDRQQIKPKTLEMGLPEKQKATRVTWKVMDTVKLLIEQVQVSS